MKILELDSRIKARQVLLIINWIVGILLCILIMLGVILQVI